MTCAFVVLLSFHDFFSFFYSIGGGGFMKKKEKKKFFLVFFPSDNVPVEFLADLSQIS